MSIDYSDTAFLLPKSRPRVLDRQDKLRDDVKEEKRVKALVRARDGNRCRVAGCKSGRVDVHHIVKRSRSKPLRWARENLVCLCSGPGTAQHHQLADAGVLKCIGSPERSTFQIVDTRAGTPTPARSR